MSELIEFLIRAKKATYAGKGGESEPSRPASHDLEYREGNLFYYDSYLGGESFAGEEALWIDDKPFWSMNYLGRVIGENFSGDFLKNALLNVPYEMLFRGPARFQEEKYTYECIVSGDFEWFHGKETITYDSEEIYECIFHGGRIK